MKKCIKCNESRKAQEFPKGKNTCKKCRNKYHKHKRESNPERTKAYWVKNKYGITLEEYNKKMNTSSGCEICGTDKKLCYDHNHDTKEFRGVLCHWCNSALGDFKDNPRILLNAVKYLKGRGDYSGYVGHP
jgi:hypothetical protein